MFVLNALICHLVYGGKCNPSALRCFQNIFMMAANKSQAHKKTKKKKCIEIIDQRRNTLTR